jgi:antitoxin (DNA-binding transcriptional repressor) of toxin-antitoxin stability system
MSRATASIRELRTDFRAVKRKIEQHGEVIITDNGEPAYVVRRVAPGPEPKGVKPMPDYFARVQRRQPRALSESEVRSFHLENRGEC